MKQKHVFYFQEQILPIVDLMAVSNTHFARLKNFIQLQLPAGFPVKIEIPLFHLVSARITFSNINKPGPQVFVKEPENTVLLVLSELVFLNFYFAFLPSSYRNLVVSPVYLIFALDHF